MNISKTKTSLPGGWRWEAGSLLIFWLILTGLSLTAHASLIANAIQVDTLTGNDDNASMAFDGANYLVSWQNSSGTSSSIDIYGKVFDSNGNLIVAPFAINASTNDQVFPSVANYGAGQFLVVYQSFNGTDQDIIGTFVSYSATNAVVGTPFTIAGGSGNQQVPSIAYDGTNFFVAYLDSGISVKAISVSKTGVVGTAVTVGAVTSNATPPSVLPQIVFSNTTVGRYLIAWEDFGTDPLGNIYGNTISTTGVIGSVTGIAVTSGLVERHPSAAFDGINFLVVYEAGAAGARDIYGQLVATGGTLSGSRFAISTAINDQLLPKVTYSTGAGLYFVSWQDYRNSTSISDIYGARILSAGSVVESAGMIVSSNTTFQKQNPASGNDGINFFALWTDFRNPPSGSDIWSQKSEGPPPVLSSVTPSLNLTVGVPMTLTGNYFGDLAVGSRSTSTDYVMINGLKVSDAYFNSWMNNFISFSLPPNSNSGSVQVYSGNLGSNTISLTVQDFSLTTAASATVAQGSSGTLALTLFSFNGFSSPVTLSVSNLPAGVSAGFNTNPVTPLSTGASATLMISSALSTLQGAYTILVSGTGGGETHTVSLSLYIAALPSVMTSPVTSITQNSATLNGTVNPNGQSGTAWFDYGTTIAYGISTAPFVLTSSYSLTSLSTPISALTLGTTYHVRMTARNSLGTAYGGDYAFSTLATPPLVATGIPSNKTTSSVTLNGTANPNGVTGSAWFEYGITTSYGSTTAGVSISGNFDNFISFNLIGLSSYSIYHFRIVASNNGGTSWGLDQTYNTFTIPFYGQPDIELLSSPVTTFNGVHSSDYAGVAVANGGDVNGDGIKDFIICADQAPGPNNRLNAGACYLFFGRPPGWPSPTTLDQADLIIYGANPGDMIGHSVSIAGDLNGDGFSEIVIGAPNASPILKTTTRVQAGQVYIINGRGNFYKDYPSGIIDLAQQTVSVTISGANPFDNIGDAVTTAGDINGDYIADLVISAPKISATGVNQSGEVYIIYGKYTFPGLIDLSTTTGGADVIIGGFQTSGLSSAISISGDVNGDGINDLIVGVQGYSPFNKAGTQRYQAGGAFLFYGRKTWPTAETPMSIQNADLTFNGVSSGDQAGSAVSLGDLNKDGKADVIIGARLASPNGKPGAGSTYIVLGQAVYTSPVTELNSANVTINGVGTNDQSGRVLNSSSDLNGDGYMDLLIGAPNASPGGRANAGSVYVILGKSVFPSVINLATGFDTIINGAYAGDYAGSSIDATGDVNGDLLPDILIGAYSASPALKAYPFVNKFAGQAYLIFGNNQYDVVPPSVPSGIVVALVSDSQIGFTWTASTDNVAVAGYEIYRNGVKIATVGGTKFTDSNLPPNTKFNYQFTAFDLAGNKSALTSPLFVSTLADTVPPTSPTNLLATAVSPSQINLSWSPGSDDIAVAGYKVWRSVNGTTYIQIANVSGTTFSSTGLRPSSINYYYVQTYDAAGNSSLSSNIASSVTLQDTIPPSTPTSLRATTISGTQINLIWFPSTDDTGVTGYQVWRSTDNVNFIQISAVTTFSYFDTGLTAVQKYYYYVIAYDYGGNLSGRSNTAYAVNDITAPTAPATVTAAVAGPGQINVSWTPATDNSGLIYQYYIYSSSPLNGPFSLVGVVGGNLTSFSHMGLLGNQNYYYYVRAADLAENLSPVSPTAGPFTTTADATPPSAPSGITASPAITSVGLNWTASTDNSGTIASYQIWRTVGIATCANPPAALFVQVSPIGIPTTNSYSDAALSPSTTYSYCILALDPSNNRSVPSGTVQSTTLPDTVAPSFPTNLRATAVSETQVNLSWSAAVDNLGVSGYQVLRTTTSTTIFTVLSTTFSDTGLTPWTNYTYTVRAFDFSGNYSASAPSVSATTLDQTRPLWPGTTGFSATAAGGASGASQINLSWPQATDNAAVTGYSIYYSTNNITFVQIGSVLGAGTTSFAAIGLQPVSTYWFYIVAFDGAGNNSLPSITVNATTIADTAPPSVPVNLIVTAISDSKLGLTWTASTDNVAVAGYTISRSTSTTGPFVPLGNWPVNSYTDSFTLIASTTYYYYVVAYDSALPSPNISAASTIASGTTLGDTTPPTVPRGIVAVVASSQTQVNLTWIPSLDNSGSIASYSIYRNGNLVGTSPSNSFSDLGLPPNQTYIYTISARDFGGNVSSLSAPVTAVTDVFPPSVPCGDLAAPCTSLGAPFAVAVSVSEIDISWSASIDKDLSSNGSGSGIAGYKIYRSDLVNPIGTSSASATIFADKGLLPRTTYNYRVSAFDRGGNESALSPATVISTPQDTTPPSVPASLVATLATTRQINLDWVPASDNDKVAGYKIYRSGVLYMYTTANSFADPGLGPNTTYSYTVSAYDRSGNESAQSTPVSATTGP